MTKSKKVTIEEIATRANVSNSTVSLALNNKGKLSENTRETVLRVAKELNYRKPNGKMSKTQTVAVAAEELPIPLLSDHFFGTMLSAIELGAQEQGFDIMLSILRDKDSPNGLVDRLKNKRVDGVAIIGGGDIGDAFVRSVKSMDVPLVLIDNYLVGESLHCVLPDNLEGGYLATQHLLQLGHQRIGFIQGPPKYKTLSERFLGYVYALRDHGIPYDPQLIPERLSHGQYKGYMETKHLLSLKDRPTAIFAVSDKAAYGALMACMDGGVKVPDEISIIGFDNLSTAELQRPPLTTVEISVEAMGRAGMRVLAQLMDGTGDDLPIKTLLGTRLVERESCSPVDSRANGKVSTTG